MVGVPFRRVFPSSHTSRRRSCGVLAAQPSQVSNDTKTTVRKILERYVCPLSLHLHFDALPLSLWRPAPLTRAPTSLVSKRRPQGNILHFYSCAPGDAVDSVLGSVKIKRQAEGLPVIDPTDERLVGFVSKSDLTSRDGAVVEDVMTQSPVSIVDSDLAFEALEIMRQFEVRSLPVLDGEHGRCVGLITMDDVAKTKAKSGTCEGGDDLALRALQLDKDSVDM
jgi:CBS domain-containing protein